MEVFFIKGITITSARLNKISLPLQMLAVLLGYYVIEAISRHSLRDAFYFVREKPLVFLYNAGLIFVTTLVVYLVRRRVFVRVLLVIFWMGLGIINGVLLSQRVTPFTGPDLHLITDALKIANRYLPMAGMVIVVILMAVAFLGLALLFFKAPRYEGKLYYRYNVPLILVAAAAFAGATNLALEKRVLSNYFGNIAFAYEDYGYPYCLVTTIFNTGINCPPEYSQSSVQAIMREEDRLTQTDTDDLPNIIFLQLESFFDPYMVNYLKLSEDPIPNFRRMMKEYSSGYYRVPSVGAGTANTEFETITGMSLRYFGPGEYPYKSILKETTCESAPFVLKQLGYTTHAIHNNEANFYGRRSIFPNLGFDTFTSEEYMEEEDDHTPLGWVRDRVLKQSIMDCLESSEGRDYIYTISVQGHGDYPEEPILEDPQITVSGSATEEQNYKWEYYVNEIHEMDEFIQELTEELEELGEPVVLVMYGDHLPTMGLEVRDMKNRYLFQTQYVIWDNMGLKKKDENLAAYQIAAELFQRLGIFEGNVFRYHQVRKNTKNYQVDLELLQYDILYGEQYVYEGRSPFRASRMRMGIYDATLDAVRPAPGLKNSSYIIGTHFTPSSEVMINGEYVETNYLNPTTLLISEYEFDKMDKVKVVQRSNSSTRKALSSTYERYYSVLKQ
ncbi:MAG: LTA synthase family protein [Lachnospiraceae bacterium]|nr:LTA synthase family protein [Lachnospiraceae bacterium]MCI9356373.1 LTA synthase family protein [Lachnospiraceae bacterium]